MIPRIVEALADLPITRAYLFGSQAAGNSGPLSDVDIAIVPSSAVTSADRMGLQATTSSRAAAAAGVEHADIVLLDEAPSGIAFAAICGHLLFDHDPGTREILEARIMSTYFDRQPAEDRWESETLARYARGEFA